MSARQWVTIRFASDNADQGVSDADGCGSTVVAPSSLQRIGEIGLKIGKDRLCLFTISSTDRVVVGRGPLCHDIRGDGLLERRAERRLDLIGGAVVDREADGLAEWQIGV